MLAAQRFRPTPPPPRLDLHARSTHLTTPQSAVRTSAGMDWTPTAPGRTSSASPAGRGSPSPPPASSRATRAQSNVGAPTAPFARGAPDWVPSLELQQSPRRCTTPALLLRTPPSCSSPAAGDCTGTLRTPTTPTRARSYLDDNPSPLLRLRSISLNGPPAASTLGDGLEMAHASTTSFSTLSPFSTPQRPTSPVEGPPPAPTMGRLLPALPIVECPSPSHARRRAMSSPSPSPSAVRSPSWRHSPSTSPSPTRTLRPRTTSASSASSCTARAYPATPPTVRRAPYARTPTGTGTVSLSTAPSTAGGPSGRRTTFPSTTLSPLQRAWADGDYYPDSATVHVLIRESGLNRVQVRGWFANRRQRAMEDERRAVERRARELGIFGMN